MKLILVSIICAVSLGVTGCQQTEQSSATPATVTKPTGIKPTGTTANGSPSAEEAKAKTAQMIAQDPALAGKTEGDK